MQQLTSFGQAEKIVDRFLALLQKYQINPPSRSGIEAELLAPFEVLELSKVPSSVAARPSLLAEAAGMFDLAAKVLSIETQPEFSTFIPHLSLFASPHPLASTVQVTPGAPTDDVHRKLTELYLGCLAIHIGEDVKLDHPTFSRGDNPDVLFNFTSMEGATKRWALAIKTISSQSGQTIFERIAEAARQINAPSCQADRGIVVINTQGSLNHTALWSENFSSVTEATEELSRQILALAKLAQNNRDPSVWEDVLQFKASPIVLFMGHAYMRVSTTISDNTPTVIKCLFAWNPTSRNDAEAFSICNGLNEFMHRIQKGTPGTENTFPE